MYYSIIIPIYNELEKLNFLIKGLKIYSEQGHEIIIINDGSNDGSLTFLKKISFLTLINHKKNLGKGAAIKSGLIKSKNNKIIIFDGDLELRTKEISRLMILNRKNKVFSAVGFRNTISNNSISKYDLGNTLFTKLFNLLNLSHHKDVLCCAKSFYKEDIQIFSLRSKGFDIDIELMYLITFKQKERILPHISLSYDRRNYIEGKKLKILDAWIIIKRLIMISIK
jgi:glycosyltransferase involved in cell wall biosynthesis